MDPNPELLRAGVQHHQAGRLQAAEQIYRQILAAEPSHVDALHLLGVIANQVGRNDAAVEFIQRAIQLQGTEASFHNNLGNVLSDQKKLEDAIASYRRALELKPDYAEALNNLGTAYKDQGYLDPAIASYRRALELQPKFAPAHTNLGVVLKLRGKLGEAIVSYRRALELDPRNPVTHNNLGNALKDQGMLEEAFACYQRALELNPNFAEAHCNLGNSLAEQGMLQHAAACYQRSLEFKPNHAETHNQLGNALKDQGKLDEALGCYRRAMQLKPEFTEAHSNALCAIQYRNGVTPAELKAACVEFDRFHCAPLKATWRQHQNDRAPNRRLRIGFVSPDLGRHPVGYFLIRTLENLDRIPFEIVCYNNRMSMDNMASRFQECSTVWREVSGLSDAELTDQILEDRIDVLFDLAGHTAKNRVLVFARKPAPIQIAWIGFEGTTGLEAIDFLLADRYTIPTGNESEYREHVLRMPEGYVCYDPPETSPAVTALPALTNGYVRFCSFNNPAKITAEVIQTWAKILDRVPRSTLTLKYRGMNDASVRERYSRMFTELGIDASRLEFLPQSLYAEYLATYGQIDIALDPFPFGGGITTCEAMWMGVPVIACPGETFASRHGLSHIVNAGLGEMVASDLNQYVELAVSLANDLPRLNLLRGSLRDRMANSRLCDGKQAAEGLARILRDVWQQWATGNTSRNELSFNSPNREQDSLAFNQGGGRLTETMKKVLNVGGNSKKILLPSIYQGWQQVLLDIDAKGSPDLVCDARELTNLPAGTFDAVYCSHNLEHYYRHDVPKVLAGFLHVLKDDGFAQIRVPDLGELMKTVVRNGMDLGDVLYQSSSGPITVLDVLYGYGVEVERSGCDFYAHKTGFTEKWLIATLKQSRFAVTFTGCSNLEIVAYAFKKRPSNSILTSLNLPLIDHPGESS